MRVLCCVIVALMACKLCPVAEASIVIDDYTVDVSIDNSGANPTSITQLIAGGVSRTVTVGGPLGDDSNFEIDSGSLTAVLEEVGSFFTLDYDLTTSTINRGFFVDRLLTTGFTSTVFGSPIFDVLITTTSAGTTPGTVSFDDIALSDFAVSLPEAFSSVNGNGHLASLAAVDTISISVTNQNPGGISISSVGSSTGIAAVPEPMSLALLGLTGAGSAFVVRRRRRQVATA